MTKPAATPPRTRSATPRNSDAARILAEVRKRAQGAQKGAQGKGFTPKLGEPTFRGPRSVLLRLDGATCAIPAGAQISIGTNPKAALVWDAEKVVHALLVHDGRVLEILNLPAADLERVRKKAFSPQT